MGEIFSLLPEVCTFHLPSSTRSTAAVPSIVGTSIQTASTLATHFRRPRKFLQHASFGLSLVFASIHSAVRLLHLQTPPANSLIHCEQMPLIINGPPNDTVLISQGNGSLNRLFLGRCHAVWISGSQLETGPITYHRSSQCRVNGHKMRDCPVPDLRIQIRELQGQVKELQQQLYEAQQQLGQAQQSTVQQEEDTEMSSEIA
ncbi:hypothetical protein NM208_g9795 [Fusarium decemcellulare]|uniref:Uncharacterized protein n=1 Tax=Fusarium decemcellulare TaxID=57161 RepID=A0ACC1S079_9HYPO|nr:hypothetical protein NM208_g9795 [Fusarium decemcellulare]